MHTDAVDLLVEAHLDEMRSTGCRGSTPYEWKTAGPQGMPSASWRWNAPAAGVPPGSDVTVELDSPLSNGTALMVSILSIGAPPELRFCL
jgi:hypothetical protein